MKLKKSFFFLLLQMLFTCASMFAQENKQKARLAKLMIDANQLAAYTAALKEEIETPIHGEPGVLTLYAVAEKEAPNHITFLVPGKRC